MLIKRTWNSCGIQVLGGHVCISSSPLRQFLTPSQTLESGMQGYEPCCLLDSHVKVSGGQVRSSCERKSKIFWNSKLFHKSFKTKVPYRFHFYHINTRNKVTICVTETVKNVIKDLLQFLSADSSELSPQSSSPSHTHLCDTHLLLLQANWLVWQVRLKLAAQKRIGGKSKTTGTIFILYLKVFFFISIRNIRN